MRMKSATSEPTNDVKSPSHLSWENSTVPNTVDQQKCQKKVASDTSAPISTAKQFMPIVPDLRLQAVRVGLTARKGTQKSMVDISSTSAPPIIGKLRKLSFHITGTKYNFYRSL